MCSPQINTTERPPFRVTPFLSLQVRVGQLLTDVYQTALLPIIIDGAAFFLYSTVGPPRLAQSYHQPALSASLDRRTAQIYMGKSHQF